MVDVLNRRCGRVFSTKGNTFNVEGIKAGAYCCKHADTGIVDIRSNRCSHESCTVHANLSTKGPKAGAYCKKHA